MLRGITATELVETVLRPRVSRAWLDELLSTPEGYATLYGAADAFAALDECDASDFSSFFVQASSLQVGLPATGAQYATTTLSITRRRPGGNVTIPAGTRVRTSDGHVFLTDSALSWAGPEVASKTVTATALLTGFPGIIPRGEINAFDPIARGITGAGVQIQVAQHTGASQPRSLWIRTDLTKPHPFEARHIGLYLEILEVEDFAAQGNVGRIEQISRMNAGSFYAQSSQPENAVVWTPGVNTTTDARYSVWYLGTYGFTWTIRDWNELGFDVTNSEPVVGGRPAMLDELAFSRGRPRYVDEGDDALARRLSRPSESPSPLGVLRKSTAALNPFGFGRHELRIYEMGEPGASSINPYEENFPTAMGFIGDLHSTDMESPETPDGMASQSPTYTTLAPFFNPGLALLEVGSTPWTVIVRCAVLDILPADNAAEARVQLFSAAKNAAQPGCLLELYETDQWSYP